MRKDAAAREALLDRGFGDVALQQGLASACARAACRPTGLSFVAEDHGRVVGTVRLWHITAGPARPALLLGPLAVDDAGAAAAIGAR